jgi:signal transduction histidine kinase
MRPLSTDHRVCCEPEPPTVTNSRKTRWILFGLFPLAFLVLGLHVREVVRTGLAQPPVYASPMGAGAYPIVGGMTVETRGHTELQVGDRLIRIGDRDLRGAGYLAFMGSAFEQAGADLRAPVVYERQGERRGTVLELTPFTVPWLRVPFLAMMLVLVGLMLVRRPDESLIQLAGAAFATLVIGESVFEGGGVAQTTVAKLVFIFGGAVWWPLVVSFIARFPGDRADRATVRSVPAMAIAAAALFVLPKCMYLLGGPLPTHWIPAVVSGADALTMAFPVGIFIANYRRFDEGERRRVKWVMYSTWAAGTCMFVALMIPVVAPGFAYFPEVLGASGLVAALIPVGITIGIVGYDLFDVDRLVSATATYSLLLIALLAMLLAMVPPLSAVAAGAFGADPEFSRIALSLVAAALAIPMNRWLQPRVDHWFFPERRRLESGIDELISVQESVSDARDLALKAAGRIDDLFRPRFTAVFVQPGRDEAYVFARGWGDVEGRPARGLSSDAPLVARLAERPTPLVVSERALANARWVSPAALGAFLEPWPPSLLLPIRDGDAMPAFIAVGPKRSGDVFTPTELALLTAALEAASRHLGLVRGAEALARERVRAEELEAAHLTRSRYLAAASHDLRQPLHALRLFSESLLARAQEPDLVELAEHIGASSSALHEMFDSLIDLSRLDQGSLVPDFGGFPIRPMLERMRAEALLVADRKGLRLEVVAPDVEVRSDPVLLGRIVQNLLTNALRYTQEGRVALHADVVGEILKLRVEDTGPGIPEAQREAVFEEFVRLQPEKSARGLGLGLAIVRKLADRMGHPLRLESEVGKGTTFTVEVPVAVRETRRSEAAIATDGAFSGRSLLLVDDDLDVLAAMRSLLQSWGARVTLATSGDEAVEAVLDLAEAGHGGTGSEDVAQEVAASTPSSPTSGCATASRVPTWSPAFARRSARASPPW